MNLRYLLASFFPDPPSPEGRDDALT